MPLVLLRMMRAVLIRRNLALPVLIVGFVFITSWPLMWLAEPAGSPLVRPDVFWWWFMVTCSTVGYGDYFPTTTGGHLVGLYVIIGGIATLTAVFAQIALTIERTKGRRMNGNMTIEHSGHVVVLGYSPGRSERLVDELLADGGRRVVLATWEDVTEHPMPETPIDFVRGDLTDGKLLRRAGVHRAHSVLVDVRDDNEALTVCLTVGHIAPKTLLIVGLRDLSRATHVRYVRPEARCVQWHNPRMMTEELQSPGIADVYTELMTHGGGNTYSVVIPATVPTTSFGEWQTRLGRRHDATVIAARTPDALLVGPRWNDEIPGGSILYYVSHQRLSPDDVLGTVRAAVA